MTQYIYMNELQKNMNNLIRLDLELNTLNINVSKIKEDKRKIEEVIKDIMIKENLKDKLFILKNKKIKYNETKSYQSYSLKYVEDRLNELIEDKTNVGCILKYLKENRKKQINTEIKILDYNNE